MEPHTALRAEHPPRLLAVVEGASDLVRWLDTADAAMTAVLEIGGLHLECRHPTSCTLEGIENAPPTGLDLVWLPTDGPVGSIEHVIGGLPARLGPARARTVVLADAGRGLPPDPMLLKKVADRGMIPGVDLSQFSFVGDDRVWLAGTSRFVTFDVDVRSAGGQRRLAEVVLGLGVFDSELAGTSWTRGVSGGRHLGSRDDWSRLLCAHYLHETLAVLA